MSYSNQLDIESLKALLKESIREVLPEVLGEILKAERLKLCKLLIPVVSDAEQQEIDQEVGLPADFDEAEFVDLTDWTENAGQLQ